MRKILMIAGLAVLIVAAIAAWQIGSCYLANVELQDDMRDIAAQTGTRIGLAQVNSDDDLRNIVIRKAQQHDIKLRPDQIRVDRSGSGETATVHLRADYKIQLNAPGWAYTLHFTPSSGR
jgi:hypothetical protein